MLRIIGGGGWLNKLKIVSILIQRGQYLPEWQLHFYIIQNRIRGVSMVRVIHIYIQTALTGLLLLYFEPSEWV